MKINDWFLNGCNYDEGVTIYAALKQSNTNLLRLFKRKNSVNNLAKLTYELSKFKTIEIKETTFKEITTPTPPEQTPTENTSHPELVEGPKVNPQVDLSKKTYKPLLINQLPVQLHPTYIQQKSDFATACSLKIQLNALAPENEETALKLCIQIEELFDSIERAWKVLDHYTETNTILEVKQTNFNHLTPAQLLQRRNQKRSTLSKEKAKQKRLEASFLKAETIALKTKITVNTTRTKEKQAQLCNDIAQLTELINKK